MWLLLVLPTGAALGGDGDSFEEATTGPRISGTLPRWTESRLRESFPLAMQRVRDVPECRQLFTPFAADALENLATSIYYPTTAHMESRVCRRGVAAFTYVGSPQVRLCRRFASLGVEQAAALLIHEALHWAGLIERPRGEGTLHARDVTGMVGRACDLRRETSSSFDDYRAAAQTTGRPSSGQPVSTREDAWAFSATETEIVGLGLTPWSRSLRAASGGPR